MAYFTRTEVELQLSPDIVGKIFGDSTQTGFGGISQVSGTLRFSQMAEQSSGYVDAFLEPAGYSVPIPSPSPFIKRCAIYRFIADVYALADLPINDQITEAVDRNESILHDIAVGKIQIPGQTQDTESGTGGNVFSATTGSLGVQMGKSKLAGTFL